MIFVTVGSMFPFDRLVGAVDDWAGARRASPHVLAQIGEGRPPRHLRWERRLDPAAWEAAVAAATLVVAHAGVGTVIAAATHGRPLVILPRLRRLGEHVSDHQLETAGWLAARAESPDEPLERRLRELGYEVVRGTLARGIEAEFRRGRPDAAVVDGGPAGLAELPAVIVRLRKEELS